LRDLPPKARWYTLSVIATGAVTFVWLVPRATFFPIWPLIVFVLLSSLTSAFKIRLPIASGVNMSVSYVVDIASLILRGPHATMIVGAASGWSQTTFNVSRKNAPYRTLFNMASLALTVEAAGQVYQRLGGTSTVDINTLALPLTAMALTYFFANTMLIAIAVALSTKQSVWRVWKTDFASSAPSYIVGAIAAAALIAVTAIAGYWPTLVLVSPPLYLTYKLYREGRATEVRQGAILEAAHDAIITVDPHLNIREFNPAAQRMFGLRGEDVTGRGIEILLPKRERESWRQALDQYMTRSEGPFARRQIELSGVRADGSEFPAEVTVVRIGTDVRPQMTAFVRDITERRALEEQLRQSQKLEAIGRLAGGVAHDFNNILMSIMGSADLMLMELVPQTGARDEATEIKQSVLRGAGLTRQLLAFSRRQATRPQIMSLGDVVGGMETMLRRLMGPEIEFELVRDGATMVTADPAQIEQVLLNLVVNARDAMPEGGRLKVRVEEVDLDEATALTHAEGRAGRYSRLSVSDTGTGIDAQTRAKLFEPFFTTKEQGKGTGLGLSIVYGIVKQSLGYITVVSEPGRGASFLIYFPAPAVADPKPVGV
jgi:PAS domain S-box-containing protein